MALSIARGLKVYADPYVIRMPFPHTELDVEWNDLCIGAPLTTTWNRRLTR